jgi:type IV secretion system protein VirB10
MVLHTLTEPAARLDPRAAAPGTALVAVSQNALPQVAGRKAGRDSLGLMAGAAGAVLLGAITLITLSNGREAKRAEAPRPPPPRPSPLRKRPSPRPRAFGGGDHRRAAARRFACPATAPRAIRRPRPAAHAHLRARPLADPGVT